MQKKDIRDFFITQRKQTKLVFSEIIAILEGELKKVVFKEINAFTEGKAWMAEKKALKAFLYIYYDGHWTLNLSNPEVLEASIVLPPLMDTVEMVGKKGKKEYSFEMIDEDSIDKVIDLLRAYF